MTDVSPILKGKKPPKARRGRKPDPPELVAAKEIAGDRSGGWCEGNTPRCQGRATNFHHIAGRGFDGCHHPDLLVHLCGNGNIDGCHGFAHQAPREDRERFGLRMARGEAHRLYAGTWEPDRKLWLPSRLGQGEGT